MYIALLAVLLFLCAYSYFVYPALLAVLGLFRRFEPAKKDIEPTVTLIIAAYNEKDRIVEKLENSLALDYPADKLQIMVASDASTDGTDDVARGYPRVVVSRAEVRKGKEACQKLAITRATGEILVFTDAATRLEPDAIRVLARNFADPKVGGVSSEDKFIGEATGEGLYVKYEMFLRRLESRVNSLVGLSGSFFAARREVCRDWADDLQSDFNTVMNCVKNGYRAIADFEMIGYYKDIKKGQSEFDRKVRTLVRGLTVFFRSLEMLNFFKYGLFSWQIFSHKLMRWLVPFFMMALLAASAAGAAMGDRAGIAMLAAQAVVYFAVTAGHFFPAVQGNKLLKVFYFFTQVNLAILMAWVRYLSGHRVKMWEPSKR